MPSAAASNGEATTVPEAPRRIRLMGMPIDVVTEAQATRHVVHSARAGVGGWVITPNLDQLRMFCGDESIRRMYEQASLICADGMPLIWASRIQKTPLPERVAGSAMIHPLTEAAAANGLSVYFLGGNPGAADACAAEMTRRYPSLKVAGVCCPEFGFDKDPAKVDEIRQKLIDAKPDIVYVGLGFPKQERLIERIRSALPNAWYLGIGISFSFVSGEVKRAPAWMQKCGLEWVHRMTQEPGRLLKRYLVHGIPFAARLFTSATVRRFGAGK